MVVTEVKQIVGLYRQVGANPAVSNGSLHFASDDVVTVNSHWSQRDIDRKDKVTMLRSHVINMSSGEVISSIGPQEISKEVWNVISPSGNLRAVVRSAKDKKGEDKQYLEIYDKCKKLKTIDILGVEKHGKIIGDDAQFGSFEWSVCESRLLYVAEKQKAKAKSFFDSKKPVDGKEDAGEELRGVENEFCENWGEQLTERHRTVLCVLDIATTEVSVLDCVKDTMSHGQAMWTPDSAGVVFCAWDHQPYRLGLKHCCQRKGGLFHLDLHTKSVDQLSASDRSARFPRFSPDMSQLVYFDTPVGGAHHQCARMLVIDWATKTERVVIDIVRHVEASSFQGAFVASMPRHIWFEDNIHLAFSTAWRSSTAAVVVNTKSGEIVRLAKDEDCVTVLSVNKSLVVASCSSISTPPYLAVGRVLKAGCLVDKVEWVMPDGQVSCLSWVSTWSVLQHQPSQDRLSSNNAKLDYESVLCLPAINTPGTLPPLIVFSHGGPHVGFDTGFNFITNFFCGCGFAVLMVNYRGSWGFGQDCIESLLGAIGDQDVKDVQSAMTAAVSGGKVDGDRLFVFGGSHGGFLTTHLIGQYSKTFKAACTRNPVTNLVSMYSTSDIKDWIYVEGGISFELGSVADEKVLPALWSKSPISHIDQVSTPLLLLVGLEDQRVPPSQSIEYYRALKAREVPVRCLTYPTSNHSLAEVDVESDCLINTVLWYNKYMGTGTSQ